eukprot:5080333-Amphidinium_carterae.1
MVARSPRHIPKHSQPKADTPQCRKSYQQISTLRIPHPPQDNWALVSWTTPILCKVEVLKKQHDQ